MKNVNENFNVNHCDENSPVYISTEAEIKDKKKVWDMIFLLCPDQAETLIKAYEEKGPEYLSKAKITISYENTPEAPA